MRTIGASNFAGQELDLTATYELNKNIKVQTGYSHSLPGNTWPIPAPHSDADFGYVMTTFTF